MASLRIPLLLASTLTVLALGACDGESSLASYPWSEDLDGGSESDGGALPERDGSTSEAEDATADSAATTVRSALAIGGAFACTLAKDGTVWCWGDNGVGQLGRDPAATPSCGSSRCSPTPAKVEGLDGVVRVVAGNDFACALRGTGNVVCWGANGKGQLATKTVTTSFAPRPIIARVKELTAAGGHACALTTDNFAYCWGDNACEIFGTKEPIQDIPRQMPGVPQVSQISLGPDAMCATKLDGTALCWGADHKGSLGHVLGVGGQKCNGIASDPVPRHVTALDSDLPLSSVLDVHMGSGVACARRGSGQVVCWGDNQRGALGQGIADADTHSRPVEVPALIVKSLDVGGQTACGVAGERLLCWGDSTFGQLDTTGEIACGGKACRALPYVVPDMLPVRELAVGPASIGTIKKDISLWLWGRNSAGELAVAANDAANGTCSGTTCIAKPRKMSTAPPLQ